MSDKILLTIISFFVLLFAALIIILFSTVEQEDPSESAVTDELEQTDPYPESEISSNIPEVETDQQPETGVGTGKIEAIKPSTPWGTLAGRVLNESDKPVIDAKVHLYRSVPAFPFKQRIYTHQSASTDDRGRYTIPSIPTDSAYSLYVTAEGFAAAEMDGISVAPDRTIQVADFRLGQGLLLKGTVTDPFKKPLEGVEVKVMDKMKEMSGMTEREAHPAETQTDDRGGYAVSHLSQSQYELTFSLEGYRSVTITENFTPFSQDEKERVTDVQLEPGGLAIRGKVVDPAGKSVAGAGIQALFSTTQKNAHFSQNTTSDARGNFQLIGLSEGDYTLWVRVKGFFQKDHVRAAAGTEDLLIRMSPTGSVAGSIQAPGKLPKKYTVGIDSYTPGVRTMGQNRRDRIKCGPKPSFRFDDLFPGKYVFLVKAPGYAHTKSPEVEVLAGETSSGLVVKLYQGGTLTGSVTDGKGNPVSNAAVRLMDKHYQPSLPLEEFFQMKPEQDKTASTNSKGNFRLEHIREGQYTLKIEKANMARKIVKQVEIREGESTDLGPIRLSRGGTIKGTAYDEKGLPSKGTKITAMSVHTGNRKTVTTDAKGRYEIKNMAPGEYNVSLTLKDFWAALKYKTSVDAYVYENQTTQLDLFTLPAERKKK